MRMLLAGLAGLVLLSAPAWAAAAAAPPAAAPAANPKVVMPNDVQQRPDLDITAGVKGWRVNGEEIPLGALQQRVMDFHGIYELNAMVQEKLLQAEAKRRNITVSEAEVDAKSKQQRAEMGAESDETFRRYLQMQQLTPAAFRQSVRNYVLMEKVLSDSVYVGDKEIQDTYNQYRASLFTRPETAAYRVISFSSQAAAAAAKQLLTQGKSWEEVAKASGKPGEAPNPYAGQLLAIQRGTARDALGQAFEAAIFSAPLNQVVGPVPTGSNFSLFRVEQKLDMRQLNLDEVKDKIREKIRQQKLQELVWPQWINTQLQTAEITPIQ
jgi:foldase protein PrsA